MGYNPISIPTAFPITNTPATQEQLLLLQKVREEANAAHELARQKIMERITQGFKPFKLRDEVWLESKHLKLRHESKKLAPKREGPFKIIEVLNPLNYRLSLPKSWRIHPVFHASLLSAFKHNDIHAENFIQPPPDLIEGQLEYEVEAIISHRKSGKGRTFLVKWKGYSSSKIPGNQNETSLTPKNFSKDIKRDTNFERPFQKKKQQNGIYTALTSTLPTKPSQHRRSNT